MASRLTFFSRSRSRQTSGCGSIRLLNSGEASYDASYSRLWIKLQRVTVLAGLFRVRITFSLGAEDRLEAPSPPLPAFGLRMLRTRHVKNVSLGAKGDYGDGFNAKAQGRKERLRMTLCVNFYTAAFHLLAKVAYGLGLLGSDRSYACTSNGLSRYASRPRNHSQTEQPK